MNTRLWDLRLTQIPFFRDDVWFYDDDAKCSVLNLFAHRRGGKSKGVSLSCNRDCRKLLSHEKIFKIRADVDSEFPVISFIAPTKVQARQIIWQTLLNDTREFPGREINNSQLHIKIPRKHLGDYITIYLLASKHHNRVRGLKNFKIYLDEVQDAPADAIEASIQPSLEDTNGEMVTTGTAKGNDHYYEHLLKYHKLGAPLFKYPITDTFVFNDKEIAEIRKKYTADHFEREYLLNFLAPIEGAFFANKLRELEKTPGFFTSEYEPYRSNILCMDIGVGKGFAAWTFQPNYERNTIDILDYYDDYYALGDLRKELVADNFWPDMVMYPHDGEHKKFSAFKQTMNKDVIKEVFPNVYTKAAKKTPNQMADIANMAENLHMLSFPPKTHPSNAHVGYRNLKEFSRVKNKLTGAFMDKIDKSRGVDHAADALRTAYSVMGIKNGRFKYKYNIKGGKLNLRTGWEGRARPVLNNHGSVYRGTPNEELVTHELEGQWHTNE